MRAHCIFQSHSAIGVFFHFVCIKPYKYPKLLQFYDRIENLTEKHVNKSALFRHAILILETRFEQVIWITFVSVIQVSNEICAGKVSKLYYSVCRNCPGLRFHSVNSSSKMVTIQLYSVSHDNRNMSENWNVCWLCGMKTKIQRKAE